MTAEDAPRTFGKRILQARLALAAKRGRPIAQAWVAQQLGVTSVTVSRWETGEKEPSLDTIARLAAVLETDPGWLAFGYTDTAPPDGKSGEAEEVQHEVLPDYTQAEPKHRTGNGR